MMPSLCMARAWLLSLVLLACSAVAAEDKPAAIPFKHDPVASSTALGNGAFGVLVISLIVIVAVLVVRKRLNLNTPLGGLRGLGGLAGLSGASNTPRLLKVLETQRLGPRALLSVVEFEGGRYLIAQSEHGITCLVSSPSTSSVPDLATAAKEQTS